MAHASIILTYRARASAGVCSWTSLNFNAANASMTCRICGSTGMAVIVASVGWWVLAARPRPAVRPAASEHTPPEHPEDEGDTR